MNTLRTILTTERYVTVPNGKFYYQEWETKDRSPRVLLMLHGLMQTSHTWDDFAPYAANKYRVLAFDQRGHGRSFSSPTKEYSTAVMAQDVKQVLDELKVDKVDLVGMSMGAANSIYFSASFPELVNSLVLIDFAPTVNPEGRNKIAGSFYLTWDSFDEAVNAIWKANPKRTRDNIVSRVQHSLVEKENGKWGWRFDVDGLQSKFSKPEAREELWDLAKKIQCPTLLVRGSESDILTSENADRLVSTIPNCRLAVVQKAGHSVAGDNLEGFKDAVSSFLDIERSNL